MKTNIIERETEQLIQKLIDFGHDPIEYLQNVVDELEAEVRLKKRKRKRRQHETT